MPTKKEKKIAKGASYTLAFERIDLALNAQFPIEAIAIEESIIADRLRSFLSELIPHVVNEQKNFEISGLLNLVQAYTANRDVPLWNKMTQWTGKRNTAIHGIVACRSGKDAKIPAENFVQTAMATAKEGLPLAHSISHWVDKEKRALKRARRMSQSEK